MSTEDEPKKLSEDDPQATPEWHRARAATPAQERLHEDGAGARADRADDRAPAGDHEIGARQAPRGLETMEDADQQPREPT
jgi:hypothetical protein